MGSPVFSVIRIAANRLPEFFRGAGRASPEDFAHAASVLLWVRWFGLGAALWKSTTGSTTGRSATFSIRSTAWGSWRPTGTFIGSCAAEGL